MTKQATVLDFQPEGRILPDWVVKAIEAQYLESKELEHKSFEFTKKLEGRILQAAGYKTFQMIKGAIDGSR